ncbi:MAG: hypothetical protein ACK4L4_20010, partial [Gemmobacter sp.]
MLGQAKAGHIFPMYLTLREAPPCRDSLAPRFVAVMRPVQSREHFLLVGDAHSLFRLHAACPRTLDVLGLDAEALTARAVSATSMLPALASHYSEQVSVEAALAPSAGGGRAGMLQRTRSVGGSSSSSTLEPSQLQAGQAARTVTLMLHALALRSPQLEQVTALRSGFGGKVFVRVRVQPVRMP